MNKKVRSILTKFGKGVLAAATHWITRITIPTLLFTYLIGQTISGVDLGYTAGLVAEIVYYITAFGIVSTALTFFKSSTPKYSVRKAFLEIFLLVVNACYFYTYKLSGALNFENIEIYSSPEFSITFMLNFDVMIYVSMATIGLNIFVGGYDLVIALVSPIGVKKPQEEVDKIGYVYAFDEKEANKKKNNNKGTSDEEKEKEHMGAYSF